MSLEDERNRFFQLLAAIENRVDKHEDKITELRTVPGQLVEIDRRLWKTEEAVKDMKTTLDTNTVLTREIRAGQLAGKTVGGVGKWIGGFIIGSASLWAIFKDVIHFGK